MIHVCSECGLPIQITLTNTHTTDWGGSPVADVSGLWELRLHDCYRGSE